MDQRGQGSRTVYRGRKFSLEVLQRRGHEYAFLRHPGAVVVLPLLDNGRAVLIRAFRPALGRQIWELPAGTLEPGEAPERAAARELEEETGYRAETLRALGSFYTTPGLTDERMHAFVGTGLTHVGQRLEPDEELSVQPVGLEEAMAMIDDGRLADAKSMLTLLLARQQGVI